MRSSFVVLMGLTIFTEASQYWCRIDDDGYLFSTMALFTLYIVSFDDLRIYN